MGTELQLKIILLGPFGNLQQTIVAMWHWSFTPGRRMMTRNCRQHQFLAQPKWVALKELKLWEVRGKVWLGTVLSQPFCTDYICLLTPFFLCPHPLGKPRSGQCSDPAGQEAGNWARETVSAGVQKPLWWRRRCLPTWVQQEFPHLFHPTKEQGTSEEDQGWQWTSG